MIPRAVPEGGREGGTRTEGAADVSRFPLARPPPPPRWRAAILYWVMEKIPLWLRAGGRAAAFRVNIIDRFLNGAGVPVHISVQCTLPRYLGEGFSMSSSRSQSIKLKKLRFYFSYASLWQGRCMWLGYVLSPSATAAARFVCVIERGDSAATQPRTNSTDTINAAADSGSQRGAHAALLAAARPRACLNPT